jgi:hypothetical protein
MACALCAEFDGFIAGCRAGGVALLIASRHGHISDESDDIVECLADCCGEECATMPAAFEAEIDRIEHWLESKRAVGRGTTSRSAIRRIDSAVRNARPHQRATINEIAKRARATALGNAGLFLETELDRLATENTSDVEFLNRVSRLAPPARFSGALDSQVDQRAVRVLILLRKNNVLMPAKER